MHKFIAAVATGAITLSMALPAFAAETSMTAETSVRTTSETNLRMGQSRRNLKRMPVKVRKMEKKAISEEARAAGSSANEACMAPAVAKREAALLAATEATDASVNAAYRARATALASAWTETDATIRQNGIRAAWDGFKLAAKAARVKWSETSKATWTTFKEEAKACGVSTTGEEGAEKVDEAM